MVKWEEEKSENKEEDVSWLISYMDMLTLLIALFVILFTYADFDTESKEKPEETQEAPYQETGNMFEVNNNTIKIPENLKDSVIEKLVDGKQNLEIKSNLLFNVASSDLNLRGINLLEDLSIPLREFKGTIIVEGHTDDLPISNSLYPSNWELSSARASSVVRKLIDFGIKKEKFSIVGYADTRPIEEGTSVEARQKNRRVTIILNIEN